MSARLGELQPWLYPWAAYLVRSPPYLDNWRWIVLALAVVTLLLVGTAVHAVITVKRSASALNASTPITSRATRRTPRCPPDRACTSSAARLTSRRQPSYWRIWGRRGSAGAAGGVGATAPIRFTSKRKRGVETNRTELLPGPLQVLGQGNGMNDAERNPKTSTPP